MALSRSLFKISKLFDLSEFSKVSSTEKLTNPFSVISVRTTTTKHWNPKYKWHRSKKIIPIKLPHTDEAKADIRNCIKDLKIFPRYWKSRPLTITTSSSIFEPYKPFEGDGKASKIFGNISDLRATSKSKLADAKALRKVRRHDSNFDTNIFLQEAHDIYVTAHTLLMQKNPEELSKYVTETALSQLINGIKLKTLHWKFIESLEPPSLVQARVQEVLLPKNLFAQLTVRFHTKQSLAIYDRFGRLLHGNEILAKDVLEYVIFEKHINNDYGVWRMHGKIIPEWRESTALSRTYKLKETVEEEDDDVSSDDQSQYQESTQLVGTS